MRTQLLEMGHKNLCHIGSGQAWWWNPVNRGVVLPGRCGCLIKQKGSASNWLRTPKAGAGLVVASSRGGGPTDRHIPHFYQGGASRYPPSRHSAHDIMARHKYVEDVRPPQTSISGVYRRPIAPRTRCTVPAASIMLASCIFGKRLVPVASFFFDDTSTRRLTRNNSVVADLTCKLSLTCKQPDVWVVCVPIF